MKPHNVSITVNAMRLRLKALGAKVWSIIGDKFHRHPSPARKGWPYTRRVFKEEVVCFCLSYISKHWATTITEGDNFVSILSPSNSFHPAVRVAP
jgi:hypothetical protein